MAAGIGLVIKIGADTKQAVNDIRGVDSALRQTGDTTSRTGKLFQGMKGPALAALAGIGAAAVAAAAAMVEFGKAAWEDHQEAERLAFTLAKIPGITQEMIDANEAWITSTMFATHVMDTDLREAVGQLAVATGDLGEAQKLARIATDVAAGANLEFSTVVDMLSKAVAGNTNALKRQMPWLDANEDGTVSLDEALQGLTDAYGGAAAAAAENDPWTTLQIIFDELKEALGQWLLPLFEDFAAWFKDPVNQAKVKEFIGKVSELARQFGQWLVPAMNDFLEFISSPEFKAAMRVMGQEFRIVANIIGTVSRAIMTVVRWLSEMFRKLDELNRRLPGMNTGSAPASAAAPSVAAFAAAPAVRAAPAATTVVFNGIVTDPESTARAVAAVLHGSDRRNARVRTGAPQW